MFTLSEIFGSLEAIESGIVKRNSLDQVENANICRILSTLPDGLLEALKEKIAGEEKTRLPISIITDVVEDKIGEQEDNDRELVEQARRMNTHGEGRIPPSQRDEADPDVTGSVSDDKDWEAESD